MSAARPLRFKVPLQSEVAAYIKEKKGWPDQFCTYYAERFWSFYQSNGWKVSGRAAMKDWKAAFNSQWQNLKHKEDIEYLAKCGGQAAPAKVVPMRPAGPKSSLELLDELLAIYTKHPTSISLEAMGNSPAYDMIKRERLWPPDLTKGEIADISRLYAGNEAKIKGYIVERTFKWYGNKGYRFIDTIELRKKLAR